MSDSPLSLLSPACGGEGWGVGDFATERIARTSGTHSGSAFPMFRQCRPCVAVSCRLPGCQSLGGSLGLVMCQATPCHAATGGTDGLLGLSSGCSLSLAGASRQRQSAGVRAGMPCAMRERSHCELARPNSQEASTSRQTEGRRGWMVQREYSPMRASSATQRTGSE